MLHISFHLPPNASHIIVEGSKESTVASLLKVFFHRMFFLHRANHLTVYQVSFAPALIGFVYKKGSAIPDIQGIIVASECEEFVRAACVEDALERSRRLTEFHDDRFYFYTLCSLLS